jgi:glycosyl transferase, family 25
MTLEKHQIFVLNLDQSSDRMAHMDKMLKDLGLNYERISAVDGSKLTDPEVKALYSPFWFGIFHGRQISRGELGCALSHRLCYRRILTEGLEWALILEDDCVLDKDTPQILEQLNGATTAFDVVQLYYTENRVHETKVIGSVLERELISFTGAHASAIAYIVTRQGAQKLLKSRRVVLTADKFVWMSALWNIRFCGLLPPAAQEMFALQSNSTIDSTDRDLGHRARTNRKSMLWKVLARPILTGLRTTLNWWRFRGTRVISIHPKQQGNFSRG